MEEKVHDKEERLRVLAFVEGVTLSKEKDAIEGRSVWPGLVFKEFLAIIAIVVLLIVWGLLVDAPLMLKADPTWTENPAKAPWYFLGLQELLVYFDPWFAGVMIPNFIMFGLIAIPYLDVQNKVSGGYTFSRRKKAILIFGFGYFMWFALIFVGVFMRGPNWAFYWPWESWEVVKPIEEKLWSLHPIVGFLALGGFFLVGMALPALKYRDFFMRYGIIRYSIMMGLFLLMLLVPIKILLRLVFNIRYVLETPWFNI